MSLYRLTAKVFSILLFCLLFSTYLTHAGSTTKALPIKPTKIITKVVSNTSDMALKSANSTSISVASTSVVNITRSAHVSTSATPPTIKPAHSTDKQTSKDSGRKFDGLSFFGGMILGAVICIILLFAVKYYQAKKRSYHSL